MDSSLGENAELVGAEDLDEEGLNDDYNVSFMQDIITLE